MGDLEEPTSVRVDGVEVALVVSLVTPEGDLLPVCDQTGLMQPNAVGSEKGPPQGPAIGSCRRPVPFE